MLTPSLHCHEEILQWAAPQRAQPRPILAEPLHHTHGPRRRIFTLFVVQLHDSLSNQTAQSIGLPQLTCVSLNPCAATPRPTRVTLVAQPMMKRRVHHDTRSIISVRTRRICFGPLAVLVSLESARSTWRRRVELHPVADDDPAVGMLSVGHAAVLLGAAVCFIARADVLDVFVDAHDSLLSFLGL